MTVTRNRMSTLKTLVAGSRIPAPMSGVVQAEYEQVFEARRVRNVQRRLLIQVLHSTRALDTALSSLIAALAIPPMPKPGGNPIVFPPHSLGSMLRYLGKTGLNGNVMLAASVYQQSIVNDRNRYMHCAGEFPTTAAEIDTLLNEMQMCLVDAFSL